MGRRSDALPVLVLDRSLREDRWKGPRPKGGPGRRNRARMLRDKEVARIKVLQCMQLELNGLECNELSC